MDKLVKPSKYNAELIIPSSKSYMQRAVALAILSSGTTVLENPDLSEDSSSALKIAEDLGCKVERKPSTIEITPCGEIKTSEISVGEAGLGLRLFTPVCSLFGKDLTISGRGSLLNRPMTMLEQPMKELGVKVSLTNGYVPLKISGKLKGGHIKINGSESSQFLTGLLIALPKAENDSVIEVENLKSIPYIKMTADIIERFSANVEIIDYKVFKIKGNQNYKACHYQVEGDWSSAAAHLVAASVAGKAVVKGLNPLSLQADRVILEVLNMVGANVSVLDNEIVVEKNNLHSFVFDATNSPDLFPVLASLASNCEGISIIKGVNRLAHKESDRALSIKEEFQKLGINVELDGDFMKIQGGKIQGGKIVSSRNDHRMAFALAVAALNANKEIQITDAQSVKKSYPKFWEDFSNSVN